MAGLLIGLASGAAVLGADLLSGALTQGSGGALKQTVASEKPSAQVTASGGSRGLGADRAAKGGANPALVKVAAISDAELAAFRKALA